MSGGAVLEISDRINPRSLTHMLLRNMPARTTMSRQTIRESDVNENENARARGSTIEPPVSVCRPGVDTQALSLILYEYTAQYTY